MTHPEYEYLKLMVDIMKNGKGKKTRGIHGIKSVFGRQVHFDMRAGFPLLTTKQMPFKILLHELFWFISGSSDVQYLFDDEAHITGILDFEKTACGPVVFDIARTLAFLIVDCKYKAEAKVRKYFLHSGYNKRGQAEYTATPLLEDLINFFMLHDFYKFLRHNPYESLEQNEHFVRTRDFLLKRNILVKTEMLQYAYLDNSGEVTNGV